MWYKVKLSLQRPNRLWGLQGVQAPRIFRQLSHEDDKVFTGRLYPQARSLVLISLKRLTRPQGHSASGTMKSTATEIYISMQRSLGITQVINGVHVDLTPRYSSHFPVFSSYVISMQYVLAIALLYTTYRKLRITSSQLQTDLTHRET